MATLATTSGDTSSFDDCASSKNRVWIIATAILAVNLLIVILMYPVVCWHFIRGYNEVSNMIVWPFVIVLAILNIIIAAIYVYFLSHGMRKDRPITVSFLVSALAILISPMFAPRLGNIAKNNLWINTPLIQAARYGDAPLVKILLQKGENPNVRQSSLGLTPLHYMAWRSEAKTVEMLLNNGADPNAKADHSLQTPLHWAARGRADPLIFDMLEKHGAIPSLMDCHGKTAADY